MNRLVRRIGACLVLSVACASVLAAGIPGAENRALDGMRFTGQTGEQGKGDHHQDTIIFENGVFRSLDCEEWGFGPAPYTVARDGDSYRFSAVLPSPNRGTLEWKGTIRGDTATAKFRWLHKRWYWTIDRHYWFEGKRQVKER